MRALCATVGSLNRPEQLPLELVGAVLIELLVRLAQRRERKPDLVSRSCDGVEQMLPHCGGLRHHRRLVTCHPRERRWETTGMGQTETVSLVILHIGKTPDGEGP